MKHVSGTTQRRVVKLLSGAMSGGPCTAAAASRFVPTVGGELLTGEGVVVANLKR